MTKKVLNTINSYPAGTGGLLPLTAPAPILPIESAQGILGQVAIQATPATPSTITTASFQKESPANLYSFSKKVRWKSENYILKLDFPCKNWRELSKDQLRKAADDYAEYFVADLLETLEAEKGDKRIQPGDDFEILFEGEKGYTAFIPTNGFNALTEDVRKLDKVVQATSDQSKTLSQIIEKIPEQDLSYAQTIFTALATEKSLATLRERIEKRRTATAIASDPINLKPQNNGCFINAAFQILVNDPNEEVFRALRDRSNYAGEEESPLYKAVIAYDKSQRLGSRCDVINILNIPNKEQADAVLDALEKFEGYLSKDADECLKTALITLPSVIDGTSLEAIASKRFENCETLEDLHNDFSIYVPRIIPPTNLTLDIILKHIIPELDDISIPTDYASDPLEDLPNEEQQKAIDNDFAQKILQNTELYDRIFPQLSEDTQKQINEARAAISKPTKNETPISIDSQGIVKVTAQDDSEKTYDLMSFISHTGTDGNGHYVTYLRKGDKFWRLDDKKAFAESISLKQFVKAARESGCYYRFKEQPLPSSSDSSNPEDKKQVEEKSNRIVVEPQEIKGTLYSEEEGKMEMKDFILVNPSNRNLHEFHPQILEVVDKKTVQQEILTTSAATRVFEPRTGNKWYNFAPGTFLTTSSKQPILHIALNPLKTEADVKQATTDALESIMKKGKLQVAFPVFKYEGKENEDTVVSWMKQAITSFVADHDNEWRTGHIKIIRPTKATQEEQEPSTDSEIVLPELNDEKKPEVTEITPTDINPDETPNDDNVENNQDGSITGTDQNFSEIELEFGDDEDQTSPYNGSEPLNSDSDVDDIETLKAVGSNPEVQSENDDDLNSANNDFSSTTSENSEIEKLED